MEIKLNPDKPWLDQLKNLEIKLYKKALLQTDNNLSQMAKLLGVSKTKIMDTVRRNHELKELANKIKEQSKPRVNEERIRGLFELGLTGAEIAEIVDESRNIVHRVLNNSYSEEKYEKYKSRNRSFKHKRRNGTMNTQEILENHRALLAEIAEKVRENRVNELTDEYMFYAQVLFKNGFMNQDGSITEEGRNVLYH